MSTVRLVLRPFIVGGVLVAGGLAIAACEATANLGYNSDAGIPIIGEDAGAVPYPLPVGPAPTPPDATLEQLAARCTDPAHGPVDRFASFAELQKKVIGRWFSCQRDQVLVANAPGIQFHADGTWNLLREEDGKLVAQRGLGNEGTWREKYTDFTGYIQIDVEGQEMVLLAFAFESAPRRMRVSDESPDASAPDGWYVTMAATDPTVLP